MPLRSGVAVTVAVVPIIHLTREPPYALGVGLKRWKNKGNVYCEKTALISRDEKGSFLQYIFAFF